MSTFARPDPAPRGSSRDDERARALAHTLRAALEEFPQMAPEPRRLADRLATLLGPQLAAIYGESGGAVLGQTAPVSAESGSSPISRILETLSAHEAGIEPGLAPEALSRLSGLPIAMVGQAVSELVQAGQVIRDAWLVRLPHANDLLPSVPPSGEATRPQAAAQDFHDERRAGDRRSIGDRRLYDRREHR
jgi:hypothetical protein